MKNIRIAAQHGSQGFYKDIRNPREARKWPEENWNIEHNDKNDGTGSDNYEDQDEAEEQGDKKNSGALILYSTLARQISIIQRILTFRTNLGNTWKMQSDVSGHMSHFDSASR